MTADRRGPKFVHQRANAAKISFAFFADVARENDRFCRADATLRQRARNADQRSETCAVIRDAGSFQARALRFTRTFVPAGNTVSRCATRRMTFFGLEPGRSPITFPILSTRTSKSVGFEKFLQSVRRAALL